MQRVMRFTGIITQGASRVGTAEYIKHFKVAYSLDGQTYTMYRGNGLKKDVVSYCNKFPCIFHALQESSAYI